MEAHTSFHYQRTLVSLFFLFHRHFHIHIRYICAMRIIINKGEITGAVDIDNMYEFASSHCTDFKDLRDDEDIVINREWILNKLTEEEKY